MCQHALESICLSLFGSGWIVSLAALKTSVPVGVIMMINAIFFTAQTALGVVMLKKVLKFIFRHGHVMPKDIVTLIFNQFNSAHIPLI